MIIFLKNLYTIPAKCKPEIGLYWAGMENIKYFRQNLMQTLNTTFYRIRLPASKVQHAEKHIERETGSEIEQFSHISFLLDTFCKQYFRYRRPIREYIRCSPVFSYSLSCSGRFRHVFNDGVQAFYPYKPVQRRSFSFFF